jgi:hypothetical protein
MRARDEVRQMKAPFTPEQLEAVDLSDLDRVQKMQVISTLCACAPEGDSLSRRRWVAERLQLPLGVVNSGLWSVGVRWPHVPARQFAKRGRQRPTYTERN